MTEDYQDPAIIGCIKPAFDMDKELELIGGEEFISIFHSIIDDLDLREKKNITPPNLKLL